MYIKRKLEDTIYENLAVREYLAVVGPRQAGKTTLIQKIQSSLKDSIYLSFEDRDLLALFDRDIKLFAREYADYKYIFIDEFQYSLAGGKNLKYLYDLHPEFKFIISGSSAIDLTVKAIKELAGRIFVYDLYQLDFEEFLSFKDKRLGKAFRRAAAGIDFRRGRISLPELSVAARRDLDRLALEFMVWGAYPRIATADTEELKKAVLKNIYNTYFLRDIRDIAGLSDDYKLARLIKGLALRAGQLAEYRELGALSGYDHLSLKKYLNILDKTYIASPVRPWFRNKRTELVKNPKYYFFDSGLRNHIVGDFSRPDQRTDGGAMLENYVFTELIKRGLAPNYWRSKQKAEVDFILPAAGSGIFPLEAKSGAKNNDISRSLHSFINTYAPPAAAILCQGETAARQTGSTRVSYLPFWLIA